MSVDSNWYRDEAAVRTELQQLRRTTGGPPQIPGYDELREIFRGGQGVVYAARQLSTRRRVAIKVASDGAFASAAARRRFEREIELAGGLRHPHIVRVYDSGVTDDARLYFVMEYVEGVPLNQWSRAEQPPPAASSQSSGRQPRAAALHGSLRPVREVLDVFCRICDAVNHAHQRGVIHRDLKPSNIRIDPAGEPHVLDFGVAKVADSVQFPVSSCRPEMGKPTTELDGACPTGIWRLETGNLTRTGEFVGTIAYAAPEQVRGEHDSIDVRTDEYALGVILYQALTGRLPYGVEENLAALLDAIRDTEPRPPSAVCPDLGVELDAILLKALAKEPAKRYPSVDAFGADLRRYLAGEPIEAKRDSAWYVLRKTLQRHRVSVAAAAAFLLLILGATVVSTVFWQRAEREADQARHERDKAEAFARFMEDTLDGAAPALARGRDTTVLKEMLDSAAKRVLDGEYAALPEIELRMRLTIGNVYRNLVDYPAAHQMLDEAEELARRNHGANSVSMAGAMNGVAQVLHNEGRVAEALEKSQASLALCRRLKLGDDWTHVSALRGVVTSLRDTARIEEAFPLSETLLSMYRQVCKGDHAMVAEALIDRGSLLHRLHRPAEALPLYEEALAMCERIYGVDRPHPQLVKCRSSLGECHAWLGRPEEALEEYQTALEMCRQLYKRPDRETARTLHILGEALRRAGRLSEAERYQRESVQMGREHPEWGESDQRLNSEFWLARILIDAGRKDEAIASLRECVSVIREQFRGNALFELVSLHILAWALLQRAGPEDAAETESLTNTSLARCRENLAEDAPYSWLRFDAMRLLGAALTMQGRFSEAEPLLVTAFDGFRRDDYSLPRPEHIGIDFQRDTLERIVLLYDSWHAAEPGRGHDAAAAEWRARLSATASTQPGGSP